jgi:hypothetical protein
MTVALLALQKMVASMAENSAVSMADYLAASKAALKTAKMAA